MNKTYQSAFLYLLFTLRRFHRCILCESPRVRNFSCPFLANAFCTDYTLHIDLWFCVQSSKLTGQATFYQFDCLKVEIRRLSTFVKSLYYNHNLSCSSFVLNAVRMYTNFVTLQSYTTIFCDSIKNVYAVQRIGFCFNSLQPCVQMFLASCFSLINFCL